MLSIGHGLLLDFSRRLNAMAALPSLGRVQTVGGKVKGSAKHLNWDCNAESTVAGKVVMS